MSIKTVKKRIATVAVAALSAGLLSVAVAPSASAAANGTDSFDIARTASTTGSASTADTIADARSVGYVAPTNAVGDIATASVSVAVGQAHTAVVLQNAKIAFTVNGTTAASSAISVTVSGGTLSGVLADDVDSDGVSGTLTLNGSATTAVYVQSGTTKGELRGVFTVSSSAAVGSTVSMAAYVGTGIAGTSTATNGTLIGTYTFTVAASSGSGVFSSALSTINTQTPIALSGTPAGTNAYDSTARINNGNVGLVYFNLLDTYGAAISTGTLTASVTAGKTIIDLSAGAGDAYAAASTFDDQAISSDANGYIIVTQPVANTAGTSTLTVTYQGAVIATKTFNWNGDIASITVDTANSNSIFLNGAADTANSDGKAQGIVYTVKDAAGNLVALSSAPTLTGATGALVGASLTTSTSGTFASLMNLTDGYGTTTMVVPTSTLNGAATYKLRVTNAAGANVDSAAVNATVAFGINSFEVAWDKTSYAPGEIATMTVKAKDAVGNIVADGTLATGADFTAPSGFTVTGAACNATKAFSGGEFTCKLGAGNTAGSYAYSFDITTATPQAASLGSVGITGTGVSNEQVLASIVKLIASINKQIRLLQKQLRR